MITHQIANTDTSQGLVTRGYLKDFNTASVLQALSLSRQYTRIELFAEDGTNVGYIAVKSGMVLEATTTDTGQSGAAAFGELVTRRLHEFQVRRLEPPLEYPVPIGRLSTQLLGLDGQRWGSSPPSARPSAVQVSAVPKPAPATRADTPNAARLAAVEQKVSDSRGEVARASGSQVPVVAIASPKGGCGKTTISVNLAVSLAQSGLDVILVDSDPNGDVLSAFASRDRARRGVYDALATGGTINGLLLDTRLDGLHLAPAVGAELPSTLTSTVPSKDAWRTMLAPSGVRADLILVDVAAGMFGTSADVLAACSHVVGVLQAETIPKRSFSMFERGLEAMEQAPAVLGVLLNMFRRSHGASLSVLVDAGLDLPADWLFETTIPKNDVFLDASEQGMPVAFAQGHSASFMHSLFDTLASEVKDRLSISSTPLQSHAGSFVL